MNDLLKVSKFEKLNNIKLELQIILLHFYYYTEKLCFLQIGVILFRFARKINTQIYSFRIPLFDLDDSLSIKYDPLFVQTNHSAS